jgi:hypothetical protein
MKSEVDRVSILEKIRDHYHDIKMLTMHCCSDISPEAIPEMIRERNELFNLIASEEGLLVAEEYLNNEDPTVTDVQNEIKSTIETILSLNKQVEQMINCHLQRIKSDLAALHKTSQAATAYAFHIRT